MGLRLAVLATLCLCVACTLGITKQVVRNAVVHCYSSAKVPQGTFDSVLKTRKIPESPEEKCFMGCLYRELGLTRNGGLNLVLAKELAMLKYEGKPDQLRRAQAILETCNKSLNNISDECILGYKTRECFITNSDDKFSSFFTETS